MSIDLPPEGHPLQKLGKFLTNQLDDGVFETAERLVLEAWEREKGGSEIENVMKTEMTFKDGELHLLRQWFDAVQDLHAGYLQQPDYELAKRIYETVGWRVPDSIEANR